MVESSEENRKTDGQVNIAFLGDIVLNGNYMALHQSGANPFVNIEPILSGQDYVIGNLECLAKGEQGENILKKPRLSTTIDALYYLKTINLSIACLANNHVYDHLEDGFNKTVAFLDQNSINHIGAGYSLEQAATPIIISHNGITIGLLNYVTEDTNPKLPLDAKVYLNIFSEKHAIEDINHLTPYVDHVVMLLHWGGRVEGGLYPDFDQPQMTHRLIDAGAGLIIGHHSHTFQPYEVYKGKYVFYSLGNFCYSNFLFEGENYATPGRRKITGIVSVSFKKETCEIGLHFYKNHLSYFQHLPAYHRRLALRNLIYKYLLRFYLLWRIWYFSKRFLLPVYLFLTRDDMSMAQKSRRILKSIKRRIA
jgi:hypothetical protein